MSSCHSVIWWRMLLSDHVILSLCNWSTKIKSNVNRQLVLLNKSVRTDSGHVYLMFSNKWCWYGVNYWLNVRRDVEQHVYNVFIPSDHWRHDVEIMLTTKIRCQNNKCHRCCKDVGKQCRHDIEIISTTKSDVTTSGRWYCRDVKNLISSRHRNYVDHQETTSL